MVFSDEFMTTNKVAHALSVNRQILDALRTTENSLPFVKRGRHIYYRKADIVRLTGGPNNRLYTPSETASWVGVKVGTLAHWRRQKINLPYLKIGGSVRYKLRDIENYLDQILLEG